MGEAFFKREQRMSLSGVKAVGLFFRVNIEQPRDGAPDSLKIGFRQSPNHALEFVMLDGLQALNVHIARLVQKPWLADGNFVFAVASGGGNRSAYG